MTAPAARLFAAADLPADVREALASWARETVGDRRDLRLVPAENLHVTLVFVGSRPQDDAERIGSLVVACAGEPCDLAVGDVLWLAPRRPHVLTIAIEDRSGALGRLQQAVSEALVAGAGHEPEPRAFRPHVTVARVRRGARVRPDPLPPPPRLSFPAEALTLYRSQVGPKGSTYRPVARATLAS